MHVSKIHKVSRWHVLPPWTYPLDIPPSDRLGADPWRVVAEMRAKLRLDAVAVQVPVGVENEVRFIRFAQSRHPFPPIDYISRRLWGARLSRIPAVVIL